MLPENARSEMVRLLTLLGKYDFMTNEVMHIWMREALSHLCGTPANKTLETLVTMSIRILPLTQEAIDELKELS